ALLGSVQAYLMNGRRAKRGPASGASRVAGRRRRRMLVPSQVAFDGCCGDNAFRPFPEGVAAMKKYIVTLTDDERQRLEQLLAKGKAAARTLRHAQALLKADQPVGWKD